MRKIEALAIDFDGVLADTIEAHTTARQEAFERLGYKLDQRLQNEAHRHGSHSVQIIGWLLKQAGIIDSDADIDRDFTVQEAVSLKKEIYFEQASRGLLPIAGSLAFVTWAAQKYGTRRLAIVTTASREHEVKPFLKSHNIESNFSFVIAQEDTPNNRLKPDPFVYQEAVRQFDCKAELVAAIEDSPRGIQSAKSAGLFTFGITTTHSSEDLALADKVVGSFKEIETII